MLLNRRSFALSAAAPLFQTAESPSVAPAVPPISTSERESRIEKARRLMAANKIEAVIIEPGSSMWYFTGTRWGRSERTFALVLPARGQLAFVVPAFEEGRAREGIRFTKDVRIW